MFGSLFVIVFSAHDLILIVNADLSHKTQRLSPRLICSKSDFKNSDKMFKYKYYI